MNRDHVTRQINENLKSDIPANVYETLSELARSALRRTARNATLDTSAVVHDAMLKVWEKDKPHFATRGHFYALMSKIMRDTVIDHVREENGTKTRG